jgi:2-succinyl-5-enolpyruvyl-6-hydroxy-3-cyclohexene-1-carboxylate synthase
VRDVESFWPLGSREIRFLANRGVNGIDGSLSTALGAAAAARTPLLAVLGDLSLLHDWHAVLLGQRVRGTPVAVVVIDNSGGGIFEFLPVAQELDRARFEQLFATPQGVDLELALQGFGAACRTVHSRRELEEALQKRLTTPGIEFLRVPVERRASVALHRALFAQAALAAAGGEAGRAEPFPAPEQP